MTPQSAAATIIINATLPPQIDFICRSDKIKIRQAENFINNLPEDEKNIWSDYIVGQIDYYYTPSFHGQDGKMYSPAEMDAMF